MSARVSADPCKDSENSLSTMCRVETLTRQTLIFGLAESCPPEKEPLCASDGQTYPSECAMTARGMQKGVKLKKVHAGRCRRLGKDNLCGSLEGTEQPWENISCNECFIVQCLRSWSRKSWKCVFDMAPQNNYRKEIKYTRHKHDSNKGFFIFFMIQCFGFLFSSSYVLDKCKIWARQHSK